MDPRNHMLLKQLRKTISTIEPQLDSQLQVGYNTTMTTMPIQLFLTLSKFINLHNPLLLMTQEEAIPFPFCTGISLPVICTHYSTSDSNDIANQLQSSSVGYNPIFISEGKHTELIMKLSDTPLLFSWNHLWVMPIEYKTLVPLRLDNNILFYEKNASGTFTVYESYSVKDDVQGAITNVLFHLNEGEENESRFKLKINSLERRSDMNGAIVKNIWKPHKKNVISIPSSNGTTEDTVGMYKDIFDILEAMLNCRIENSRHKGFFWGKRLSNGTWTGPMGQVIEGEFDFKAGLLSSPERQQLLDFGWKIDETRVSLMSSESTLPKLDVLAYITIFPVTAWVTGLVTMVVAALCFSLSSHESIPKGLTLMVRLFLQMGYDVKTKGIASKLFMLIAALCLNLVFIYYCSDLTSKMTAEPKKLNIKSFEDVEKQGYELVIEEGDGSSANRLLRTAPKGSAKRRMYDSGNYIAMSKQEMKSRVMNNPKSLMWAFDQAGFVILDVPDNVAIDKSLAFQKGSELIKIFNNNLLKMYESGLMTRVKKKWYGEIDEVFEMVDPLVLTFDNLFFPFGCLILGIIFAIPMVVAEVIGWKCMVLKSRAI